MVTKDWYVYKHTSPSGKVYIGITSQNPLARWKNGLGYKSNHYFFSAILKYGWDNFNHEILYTGLTSEEASIMEIALISEYKSNDRLYGYNISSGGFTASMTEEGRARLSESMKRQYEIGQRSRKRGEEANRKTSRTLKMRFENGEITRIITEEQKKKLSEAHKGKKLSDEHKEKIKKSAHTKTVLQLDGEKIIAVYDGVRKAGRETGLDYTGIIKVLKGKKQTCGGYMWKYGL